jgi:uncharacterized membrane protein YczE
MQYFIGIIVLAAGIGLVIKTEWVLQNFGTSAWAEAKLGYNGGSRLLYKCIGLILILVGFMLITNLFGSFVMATVGKLFIR